MDAVAIDIQEQQVKAAQTHINEAQLAVQTYAKEYLAAVRMAIIELSGTIDESATGIALYCRKKFGHETLGEDEEKVLAELLERANRKLVAYQTRDKGPFMNFPSLGASSGANSHLINSFFCPHEHIPFWLGPERSIYGPVNKSYLRPLSPGCGGVGEQERNIFMPLYCL